MNINTDTGTNTDIDIDMDMEMSMKKSLYIGYCFVPLSDYETFVSPTKISLISD
jgi:hypothetical protein